MSPRQFVLIAAWSFLGMYVAEFMGHVKSRITAIIVVILCGPLVWLALIISYVCYKKSGVWRD
jgi:CHASE2 domain-containing sensor protein